MMTTSPDIAEAMAKRLDAWGLCHYTDTLTDAAALLRSQAQTIAALQAALMVPDDDEGMPGSQPQSYKEFSSSCDRLDGKL